MTLANGVAAVVDAFTAAGLTATTDPRDFNPPGVLVRLPVVNPRFGKLCADVEWSAYLVTSNTGPTNHIPDLSALLDDVLTAGFPVTLATPYDLQLPGGGDPAPAFLITWRETIPIGD